MLFQIDAAYGTFSGMTPSTADCSGKFEEDSHPRVSGACEDGGMTNHDLTAVALNNLERELAEHPSPQSAYCADAVDSLRFHLHVHAAAMIAELKRRRSDDVTLRAVANEALDHWEGRCYDAIRPIHQGPSAAKAQAHLERIADLRMVVTS